MLGIRKKMMSIVDYALELDARDVRVKLNEATDMQLVSVTAGGGGDPASVSSENPERMDMDETGASDGPDRKNSTGSEKDSVAGSTVGSSSSTSGLFRALMGSTSHSSTPSNANGISTSNNNGRNGNAVGDEAANDGESHARRNLVVVASLHYTVL